MSALSARPKFAALIVSFGVMQLVGCMAFQSNDARQLSHSSLAPAAPRSEKLKTNFQVSIEIVGVAATNDLRQSAIDNIGGWAKDAFESTGVFQNHPDPDTADHHLVIRVRDDADVNMVMAVISGATMYLVPNITTDTYTTDIELTDAAGTRIAHKQYHHSLKMVQQLLLVFGAPFATVLSVEAEMWSEVLRDAAVWAAEQVATG